MKTKQELRDDLVHITKSAQAVSEKAKAENRPMSAEEMAEVEKLMASAKATEANIDSIDKSLALEAQIKAANDALSAKPQARVPAMGNAPANDLQPAQAKTDHYKLCQLRGAFAKAGGDEQAYISGLAIRAQVLRDIRAEQKLVDKFGTGWRNAMSTTTDTAGGVLVPDSFIATVINLREDYGVFRRNTRVIPVGSGGQITIPRRSGGYTAYPMGQNSTGTESELTFNNVSLTAKKYGVFTKWSKEIDEDAAIDLAMLIAEETARAFAEKEDRVGFNGTGSADDHGVFGLTTLLVDSSHTASKVTAGTNINTFEEITNNELTAMIGKLPVYARNGAAWYISGYGEATCFGRLRAAAGGNTVINLNGQVIGNQYLGYPVVVSQVLPTSTSFSTGQLMLAFGNLRQSSTMIERRGLSLATSADRYFELDQVAMLATERIDINNHDLGDTSNAGPFVYLASV